MNPLSAWLTQELKVHNPGKKQIVAESIVLWLDKFTISMLGENAKEYSTYISTILLYIGLANIIGIFGMKPPTKDMNVTIALALMSIILIEISGIRAKGMKGWIKSFTQPVAVVTPINILEVFTRPLSLCMRLFGNVIGAFVIMEMIKMVVPVFIPTVFSLYFDFFDGFIQAYVFVFLTSLFIAEATETESDFTLANQQKQEALESKNKANQQLENMQTICDGMLADAKEQASLEYEQIIADANKKSDEMIEQARIKTIEVANEEKAKAKSEIADLINKAADKITNTKSDEKLYDDFLKEMK